MNNKNIFIRCLSSLTAFSILFASVVCGYNIAAAENEVTPFEASGKAKLTVDFLGIGETPSDTSKGRAGLSSDDNGSEFWIGVAIDEFSDTSLITNGIHTLELGFDYDPDVVVPYETNDHDWEYYVDTGNLKEGATNQDKAYWSKDYYRLVTALPDIGINENILREELSEAQTHAQQNWQSCFVSITKKDNNSDGLRFLETTIKDKIYILKLPFKLVAAPESIDADNPPLVIWMSRGPETFVIGSGADGTPPYGAWESTVQNDEEEDVHNLKTVFEYGGEISLFVAGDDLEGLKVYKGELDEDESLEDNELKLSQSAALNEDGFLPSEYTYYLRVTNDITSVKLIMTKDEKPQVDKGEENYTVTRVEGVDDAVQWEATVDLDEFDKDKNGGFSEDVVITSGGTTYHVYIQRLLKPKIELEYGNSPYGEIMRAENIPAEDKDKAKEEFSKNQMYSASYLPDNVKDKINMRYTLEAWGKSEDENVNMDRNEYAIFAYEKTPFYDTGFTATNSFGETVDPAQVTRTIEVMRLSGNNINEDVSEKDMEKITINPESDSLAAITDSSKNLVRPDVYKMYYTFTDNGEPIEPVVRYIIVIPLLGDVNMVEGVNGNDAVPINSQVQEISTIINEETAKDIQNLFLYRVCDVNMVEGVNGNDAVPINAQVQEISFITDFYKTTTNKGGI